MAADRPFDALDQPRFTASEPAAVSGSQVRHLVADVLSGWGCDGLVDDPALCASELAERALPAGTGGRAPSATVEVSDSAGPCAKDRPRRGAARRRRTDSRVRHRAGAVAGGKVAAA